MSVSQVKLVQVAAAHFFECAKGDRVRPSEDKRYQVRPSEAQRDQVRPNESSSEQGRPGETEHAKHVVEKAGFNDKN